MSEIQWKPKRLSCIHADEFTNICRDCVAAIHEQFASQAELITALEQELDTERLSNDVYCERTKAAEQERDEARQLLALAAQEINCAGPVHERIRVLRREMGERVTALEQQLKTYKTLASVGTWHKDCRPNRKQAADTIAKEQATIDKLADTISTLQQQLCVNGDNCPCAISTRHEWFEAFCKERDKLASQGTALRALIEKWRERARLDDHAYRSGADSVYRDHGRLRSQCADDLEALLGAPDGTPRS